MRHALKRVTIAESGAERTEVSRGHSSEFFIMKERISRSLKYTGKGGMTAYDRKHGIQWLSAER